MVQITVMLSRLNRKNSLRELQKLQLPIIDANTEWVRVVGEKALPAVELF
jgi:hypothetical protein